MKLCLRVSKLPLSRCETVAFRQFLQSNQGLEFINTPNHGFVAEHCIRHVF